MVSNEVAELIILAKGKIIGMGNTQADSMVEEDDPLMLHDVNEGGELTHDEFFIFGEFLCTVLVSEEDCCLGGCEGDVPLPMCLDRFAHFQTNAHVVDCNVDVSD